jgi:hypothetical protein
MDGLIDCVDGWRKGFVKCIESKQTAVIERVENTAGDSLFGNGVSTNPDGV